MKILNKFIWSKKEPLNKNDVWFDGSTWRMYTEEAWQSFTLPVDAADKVAKVIENVSEVYQEKLNAGEGIVIKGNTISVDDSIKYDDSDVWEAIEILQQNKVEQTQLNDYVSLDRYTSTSQMLIENIGELDSTKADKAKTEQELNKKLNKTDIATINGKSLTEGGNITIKESTSFTPDWNAGEGEEGHIKNRTHYADFVEVDIPEDIASSEVELTIPNIVGAPILVHYAILSTSKYLKISPNDHELHVLSYGPAFKIRRGDGNNIFVSGHNAENHRLYIATHFVALNEIFLPETIAKKSDLATINGQRIDEGGNIEIKGGGDSYDDTAIKEQLTELSEDLDAKVDKENVTALMGYQNYVGKLTKEQATLTFSSTSNNILLKYTVGGRDIAKELLAGESITIGGAPLPPVTLRFYTDGINKYTLSASSTTFLNSYNIRIYADLFIPESVREMSANMQSITYAELVSLRDNYMLSAGMQYRITDYMTTTAQENTQSAGHQFDVIVTADNATTLNEVARACLHEGDTYFSSAGAKLEAWQLWYSLDNDAERFAWADAENGKGVIYRMSDEWNNDCPYDFKNIQFKRWIYADGMGIEKEEGDGDFPVYCYTFSWEDQERVIMDASIVGNSGYLLNDEAQISGVYGNTIKPYISYTGEIESPRTTQQFLNNIVFLSTYNHEDRMFYGCYSNSFGNNCYSNSFGNGCSSNSFGYGCSSNSFDNGCYSNSFGNDCYSAKLDDFATRKTASVNSNGEVKVFNLADLVE